MTKKDRIGASANGIVDGNKYPGVKARHKKFLANMGIIREFAVADFRLRYHDSVLGYIWFLLSPILMFSVYYFVFSLVISVNVPNFAFYLILGILSYNYFQDCTFSAMYSIMSKASLIKKVNFPRYLIVFASSMTGTFSLLVNLGLVVIAILISRGVPPLIWLLPIPIICLFLFSTGVGFILAALHVRFRDLSQIWNVLVLALFWLTPVVYDIKSLPPSTQIIVFLNPLARIFMLFRHYLLYDFFEPRFLIITIAVSVFVFFIGFRVFRHWQDQIAVYL